MDDTDKKLDNIVKIIGTVTTDGAQNNEKLHQQTNQMKNWDDELAEGGTEVRHARKYQKYEKRNGRIFRM